MLIYLVQLRQLKTKFAMGKAQKKAELLYKTPERPQNERF